MASKTPIQLHIPLPCNESWDEMTLAGNGKYCNHCQKTVIDFTSWSDLAMHDFFSKNKGKVCGRFLVSQINRPIQIPYQPHSRLYHMVAALGFTLLFTASPEAHAQNKAPNVQQASAITPTEAKGTQTGTLRGKVTDSSGHPVLGATLRISNADFSYVVGAHIHDNGDYCFSDLPRGNYKITISWARYLRIDSVISIAWGETKTVNLVTRRMTSEEMPLIQEGDNRTITGSIIPVKFSMMNGKSIGIEK